MKDIDAEKIPRLVEGYFSCSLSVKEERELGRILAAIPPDKLLPDWEDALAELSFAARARQEGRILPTVKLKQVSENACGEGRIFNENAMRPSEASLTRQMGRIFHDNAFLKLAASVAVILVVAFFALRPSFQTDACYAYVNGQLVTDRQDISRLMDQQLGDMASAQEKMMASVNLDLSEMAAYIEDNE